MKSRLLTWIGTCLLASLSLLSCNGGNDSETAGGGISGTGRYETAAGTVTATGSITVNGVRYETDSARVVKEGTVIENPVFTEGMVVHVDGRLNEDTVSGTAEQVEILTAVRGTVEAVGASALVIAGQTVMADDNTIIVDADDPFVPLLFEDVAKGDYLEISGLVTPLASIQATRIERIDEPLTDKVAGLISTVQSSTGTFSIGPLTVEYKNAVLVGFQDSIVTAGVYVEVIGQLVQEHFLEAQRVVCKNGPAENTIYLEVDGYSNGETASGVYVLITPLGPVTVSVDDNTTYEGGDIENLNSIGARMIVTGSVRNSTVSADTILFNGIMRVEATAAYADGDTGAISLAGMPALQITCNPRTVFKDRRPSGIKKPLFPDILDTIDGGEWLIIKGRLIASGQWTATKVTIDQRAAKPETAVLLSPSDGPASGNTFALQGITIETRADTAFSDEHGTSLSRQAFLSAVQHRIVKTVGIVIRDNAIEADEANFEE